MDQKYVSSPGLDEAETSLKQPPREAEGMTGGEYVPMMSADSGKGMGFMMQNLATGEDKKEGSPDLFESRPSISPPHSS